LERKDEGSEGLRHYLLNPEEKRPGYARFACPEQPDLKFIIFQTIDRCPVCGDWKPLDEKRIRSDKKKDHWVG
jgi:hypothetical protein